MLKIIQIILMNIFVIFSSHAATQPKFTFTPLTDTTVIMSLDQTVVVRYLITNQTTVTRTLTVVPTPGITQTTAGTGVCPSPFTLAHGQSCVLTLSLYGINLSERTVGGPKVCKTKSTGDTQYDPFLCSQPSIANQLNITRLPIERPILFDYPPLLTFEPNGSPQSITITNSSTTITARNVRANFINTALDGNVSQDASACRTILPGEHCNLVFTPGSTAVSNSSFPINGADTQIVAGNIEVVSPSAATITVEGSPVELDRNNTLTLTVNNTSLSLDANAITAHNVPTGVTASACMPDPTPHGSSCSITFTSGSTPVEQTTIDIYGTNTSHTTVSVTVNPSENIAFVSSSSLILTSSGSSTGQMVIQNISSSTITGGLMADFSGTALSGSVEATGCEGDLAAGATCTITFKAEFTNVLETAFPIHSVVGSSTNSLVGTITILAAPVGYLTTPSGNSISQCSVQSGTNNFTNCQVITSLGLASPQGITLDPGHTHAYIVNKTSSTVTYCEIDTKTLNPVNCTSAAANGLNTPVGIAINPAGTYAYVTNLGNNTVSKCAIQGDGGFNNTCINSGATSLITPNGIVIKPTNDFAYISGGNSAKIYQCALSVGGNLSGCTSLFVGFGDVSTGITISNNRVYEIAYGHDTHVHEYTCTLVNGGGVTGCTRLDLSPRPTSTTGMVAISTLSPTSYIGVTVANQYIQCILGSNGVATSCTIPSTTPGNNWGVTLLE